MTSEKVEVQCESNETLFRSSASLEQASTHDSIVAGVSRLVNNLQSNTVTMIDRRKKNGHGIKKFKQVLEHKFRKKLILLDYQGASDEIETFSESDKLYDGTVEISTIMPEERVRNEIGNCLQRKENMMYNLSVIKDNDFEFVKCSNRKIRIPDGDHQYNGRIVKQIYSGAIYIRLTSCLPVQKVIVYCIN